MHKQVWSKSHKHRIQPDELWNRIRSIPIEHGFQFLDEVEFNRGGKRFKDEVMVKFPSPELIYIYYEHEPPARPWKTGLNYHTVSLGARTLSQITLNKQEFFDQLYSIQFHYSINNYLEY